MPFWAVTGAGDAACRVVKGRRVMKVSRMVYRCAVFMGNPGDSICWAMLFWGNFTTTVRDCYW